MRQKAITPTPTIGGAAPLPSSCGRENCCGNIQQASSKPAVVFDAPDNNAPNILSVQVVTYRCAQSEHEFTPAAINVDIEQGITKRLKAFLLDNPNDLNDAELSTLTGVAISRIRDIRLQNERAARKALLRSAAGAIGTTPAD
jgi:hypothetical protein